MSAYPTARRAPLLHGLGRAVRDARTSNAWTLRELAQRAGVSARFLVQLEGGSGNISVSRLKDVADALGVSLVDLVQVAEAARLGKEEEAPRSRVVSLLGLRGAGKSAIGAQVARKLKVPFVELDQLIAREAGMDLSTIFEMHGEAHFQRIEEQALDHFLDQSPAAVLATGGSIVMHPEAFALLRRRTLTVWLKAKPTEHWDRVVAQGDGRPMRGRPAAMSELRRLLKERTPLYAQASHVVDTSTVPVELAAQDIVDVVTRSRRNES